MTHLVEWDCSDCGEVEVNEVSKMEAAFWEANNPLVCKLCGAKSGCLSVMPELELDQEILTCYINNPKLFFWSQDDEIFLSLQPLSVLLEAIQAHQQGQQGVIPLIQAIPVKLYGENFASNEERQTCVTWIKENRSLWEPLSESYIKHGIRTKIPADHEADK